jgi:hypothetical protein
MLQLQRIAGRSRELRCGGSHRQIQAFGSTVLLLTIEVPMSADCSWFSNEEILRGW